MDNRELWIALGMDLEKHDDFLAPVPAILLTCFWKDLIAQRRWVILI